MYLKNIRQTALFLLILCLSGRSAFASTPHNQGSFFIYLPFITQPVPTLTISDATAVENTSAIQVTVTLQGGHANPVTVQYASFDVSTQSTSDYTPVQGTLTWPAYQSGSQTITIAITDDAVQEATEQFILTLSNATNATIADSVSVITILDDELTTSPTLTIANVTIDENGGSARVTVKMTGISSSPVTVNYATTDGTAVVGSDYLIGTGVLMWNAGETGEKVFNVVIINDDLDEPTETFNIMLTNAVNAAIGNGIGLVAILDDESTPTITIQDTAVAEDTGLAIFILTLHGKSSMPVSISYATADVTAVAPNDYMGSNSTITWLPGETGARAFAINIINDVLAEPDETFAVQLFNAFNANVGDSLGVATILDNDNAPQLFITDVWIAESAPNVTLEVTMVGGSSQEVTVSYATLNDTATAPGDYTAVNGTLTWAANETGNKTFLIPLAPDTIDEPDETFILVLSNPVNAFLGDDGLALVTIADDDPSPGITITDLTLSENQGPALVKVTLVGASSLGVTVSYATNEDTAGTGTDYTESAGTLSWSPDESGEKTISIPLNDDNIDEIQEQFFVNLSNANHATINDAQGIVRINDNDLPPTLTVADTSVSEAAGTIDVVVTLTRASGSGVTINFATEDLTANFPDDYLFQQGQLVWDVDETGSKTVTIPIVDDMVHELNEIFRVVISNPIGGVIVDNLGDITIIDNDPIPQ